MLQNKARKLAWKTVYLSNFIPLAFLICSSLFFHVSCRHYADDTLIKKVDSLIIWNTIASQSLVSDVNLVQRIDSMNQKLKSLNSLDSNRMNEELRRDLKEYNGIFISYRAWNNTINSLQFDNKENESRLNGLKKAIINREKRSSDFEALLHSEKLIITKHLIDSQRISARLQSVENMYQRLNNKLTDFYIKNFAES